MLGALALVASAAAADPSSTRIPLAKFAALPQIRKPVLSPDGRRVAALSVADDKSTLMVLNADQPDAQGTALPLGRTTVADLIWGGNSRLLIQVQSTQTVTFGSDNT